MSDVQFAALILAAIMTACVVVITTAFYNILTPRKSQNYRKHLSDMWVAAKIRALAKEDGLDVDAENELLKNWVKKEKLSNPDYDLDRTIEAELKTRIGEPKKKK